jgi:hypothetical protein
MDETSQRVVYAADANGNGTHRWRPSYMMPRSACRIVLRIASQRVERLTRITRADARREGCPDPVAADDPIVWFRTLWDSLCKRAHAWQADPWVWVIGFEMIQTEDTACADS